MKMHSLLTRVVAFTSVLLFVKGEFLSGTVYMTDGKPNFVAGKLDKNGAAYGTYNDSLLVNGWGVLEINTGGQIVNANLKMFAAGFIEGTLTASQMWAHYQNIAPFFLKGKNQDVVEKVKDFFTQQDKWMRGMIAKYAKIDPLWAHAGYILAQYDGLYAGYKAAGKSDWDLSLLVVQVLNGAGDLLDLIHVVDPEGRPNFDEMSHAEVKQYILENSHCSALIKVLGAYENIFMSHSSWFTYSATSRIFKYYNFNLGDPNTSATKIAFSSYPGTYNNQYMILDLKRIKLRTTIEDGALWVVEQIPTLVEGGDQTTLLRAGYWPSYNVPFYEEVYNKSGYPAIVKRLGLSDSYQLAPRAKIFRRDQDNVHDMKTMQNIMRYNDYLHDPYSDGQPCNTICCRGDLDDSRPSPMGCYDTKVADYAMAEKLQAFVINGPTLGTDLKPFSWTGEFKHYPHVGLPKTYNFPWVYMKPT